MSDDKNHGQPGHNSGITGERLKSFIERVERLEEEKAALAADIKDVYAEAKSAGFDVKIMRQVVRIRKQDPQDRREQEKLLELYMSALGMLADTPLGESALERAGLKKGDSE
jgi:uncharacterized protein (UPF0335 family)